MAKTIRLGDTEVPAVDISPGDLDRVEGDLPDSFDVEAFHRRHDRIHGETVLDDGSLVMVQELDDGRWRGIHVENPDSDWSDRTLWDDPSFDVRAEFSDLVRRGLTPAQALDYWMVVENNKTASAWAEERDVNHQAVSENVRKAKKQLAEDDSG